MQGVHYLFGKLKSYCKEICVLLTVIVALYGGGRLYFYLTDGFAIENITSQYPYDVKRETRSITQAEQQQIHSILSQKFSYLGKGCQSYVFVSEDDNYVLKFFKYQ